jgi:hypothetical protein
MFRTLVAAAILAGVPALAQAQSASAPLIVTATVVSSCKVGVPKSADPAHFSTLPVDIRCARGGASARVQRPAAPPRRIEMRDAVLVIDF